MIAIKTRTISALLAALIIALLVPISPASANGASTITLFNIEGVTPPVAGATPVQTITPTDEYTGTVSWGSSRGALIGNFEPNIIYAAYISLTPASGRTFNGIDMDFFRVEGATYVTFNYSTSTITAIFTPAIGDAADFRDELFGTEGSFSVRDFFGESPLNESDTVVGSVKVDQIEVDSQNRIVVLASFDGANNQVVAVSGINGTEIGTGYRNSINISAQSGNEGWSSAAVAAREYTPVIDGVMYDDWYLPSRDELNVLYVESVTVGGNSANYWSSSESNSSKAVYKSFTSGTEFSGEKSEEFAVRPIRAGLGTYSIGAQGPGGGKIFYIAPNNTTFMCGSTLASSCNYLEAAPHTWSGNSDPLRTWTSNFYSDNHILFRLKPDGSYDYEFGNPGLTLRKDSADTSPKPYVLVTTTRFSYTERVDLEIDSDDNILVLLSGSTAGEYSGEYHNFVARYTESGNIDSRFGDGGDGVIGTLAPRTDFAESLFADFTLGAGNRILVASLSFETPTAVVINSFDATGLLDVSFGTPNTRGTVSIDISYPTESDLSSYRDLQIIADDAGGFIIAFIGGVLVYSSEPDPLDFVFTQLLRIDESGNLDNAFKLPSEASLGIEEFDADKFIIPGFFLTDLAPDGPSGFIISGTFYFAPVGGGMSFGPSDFSSVVLRFETTGEIDTDFAGPSDNPLLSSLFSESCANSALLRNSTTNQPLVGVLVSNFCGLGLGSLKAFSLSGAFQGEFYLEATPNDPGLQIITQLEMTPAGKLLVLKGVRPRTGFFDYWIQRGEGSNYFWTNATISRYSLPSTNSPLGITGPEQVEGVVGTPIDPVSFTVTGGTGIETITVTSGYVLPAGLTLSTEGQISGTPLVAGTTTTSFTVTDSSNETLTAYIEFVISLATPPPAQAPIPAPPPPVPYLNTLTAPKIQLKEDKLICTPGTYNAGYTIGGVNQGSSTSLFTPATFTYNLFVNGVRQNSLTITSVSATVSWSVPTTTSGALITCSVTVSANGVTNTDRSSDNTAGVNEAAATQRSAIAAADSDYLNSLSANAKAYQKALIDNRTKWRSDTEKIRSNYYAERDRLRSLPSTKATRALVSTAFKSYITAQKESASIHAASKPAAQAAKDAADKSALDAKSAATTKALTAYGSFLESIGYGVLIP